MVYQRISQYVVVSSQLGEGQAILLRHSASSTHDCSRDSFRNRIWCKRQDVCGVSIQANLGNGSRLLEVRGKLAMFSLKQGLRGLRGYEMRKEMRICY